MNLIKLLNYSRKVVRWIFRGKFHIATIVVILITILYLLNIINYYPIYISSIFSISGITIILLQQLLDAKQFSDYKPNTFKNWVKSFPNINTNMVNLSANFTSILNVSVHSFISISENVSLEKKVEYLLKEIDSLKKTVNTINDNLIKTNNVISVKINELTNKIDKVDKAIKTLIAGHVVGSYDLNFFGIIITLCGSLIHIFR